MAKYVFDRAVVDRAKANREPFGLVPAEVAECIAEARKKGVVEVFKYSGTWGKPAPGLELECEACYTYRIRPDWQPPAPEPEFEEVEIGRRNNGGIYRSAGGYTTVILRVDFAGFIFPDGTVDYQHFRQADGTPARAWRRKVG